MKLGPESKKIAILGGLVLVGGYLFYQNVLSSPSSPAETRPAATRPASNPTLPAASPSAPIRRSTARSRSNEDFRPPFKSRRAEDRVDPTTVDPTLRLDLLAKVQGVELQGGQRNLFQFSAPPPPPPSKTPEPKIVPGSPAQAAKAEEAQKSVDPPKPPPPPINLKYYGYTSARGSAKRRAFLPGRRRDSRGGGRRNGEKALQGGADRG